MSIVLKIMNPVRGGDHGDYMLNSMKNDNHKLKNIENRDFIRSRSASNGVNKTINKKVAGMGVMMGVLAVGFLWGAQGAEAAE